MERNCTCVETAHILIHAELNMCQTTSGTVPESRAEAFIKAKHQTASTPPISPRCFSTMLSVCADCRVVPSCTLGAV
eukprot:scaffold255513_cov19-Tisochrysis_lutea.AAC.1